MQDLQNKIAVVTGGAAGLGRSIALRFSELGASVVIADIGDTSETEAAIKRRGGVAKAFHCDVSDEASVTTFAEQVYAQTDGKIDVLINNAGTNGECNLIENMPIAAWERTLRINVTGMMLVTKAFIPGLVRSGGGNIVNIASNTGRRGVPWRADYACSKWAVIGFTQTLAMEVAHYNIRANVVNPGPVAGDRIEQILEMHAAAEGRSPEEIRAEWIAGIPTRRFVEPSEVARIVSFLCLPESSALTGQGLEASGGLIMH